MKAKWEAKCIAVIPKAIHQDKFDQRIAEVAEVLYDLFRQLDESDLLREPMKAGVSTCNLTLHEERTGTHG